MGETNWTPGQWTASPVSGIVGSLIVGETMADKVAAAFPQGTPNRFDFERTQANAQLIATAPDLYKALEKARDTLNACGQDTVGTPTSDLFRMQVDECDAVLKKARGER